MQLGTVVAQLDQLGRELASAGGQQPALEAERVLLRDRADSVAKALERRLADDAGFRGDLEPIQQYELGNLLSSGNERQRLARYQFNSVMLFPDADLRGMSEAQLRNRYEDLLTPGQFVALQQLHAKRPISDSDWQAQTRLHDVTVSQYVGRILFAQQALDFWRHLTSRVPRIGASDTLASVQTAALFLAMLRGVAYVDRTLGRVVADGKWAGVADTIEQPVTLRLAPQVLRLVQEWNRRLAAEIRTELAAGGRP